VIRWIALAWVFVDEGFGNLELALLAALYVAGATFWAVWKFTDLLWWIR
jgi:hypothetical protein